MKFFRAENANRLIGGVRFEAIEIIGGTLIGVLAADGELEATLAALAAEPRNGVKEISESEYLAYLKKKAPSLGSLPHSNLSFSQVAVLKATPSGKEAVVVPGNEVAKAKGNEVTVEEALSVSAVNPPSEEAPAPPSSVQAKRNQKRKGAAD